MKTSDSIKEIASDVILAHAEMKEVERNTVGVHSPYADLEAVLGVIRPVLAVHNLALLQFPAFKDGMVYVVSRLLHKSGEWFEEESSVGVQPADPQKAGATFTYLRRYSAMSICGIAPKDDIDNPNSKKLKKGQTATTSGPQTEKSIEVIVKAFPADVKELLKAAGVYSLFDAHKLYKKVAGDMDALKQLCNEMIRAKLKK